ncbi:rRNA maturation RNase YbeY [Leptothoe sp. PORK10 BA2]|uniref:rRNA maturation RNase YbeY n=1 Tax=Leptothoe sp. PORK10 BA2 TaxID=3110254 RepID=UPI002B1F9B7D|nr:rRNA maturation RNase YbeY [Leptothoe sp. PORK10 BA2]MEA5465154.1 rRNA maturation RNase YbeY [Leptothoe sp. PORK10 BA2]
MPPTPLELELWVETVGSLSETERAELPSPETWQTWFRAWLTELTPTASPINRYEVSLLLTDDATIQQLNATYRHQDKATDVLAFAAQETDMPGAEEMYQAAPLPLGDVIISVETAQRQRHGANYSITQELAWLATHGLLHLLGWDHPDDSSLNSMLDRQSSLLRQLDLIS